MIDINQFRDVFKHFVQMVSISKVFLLYQLVIVLEETPKKQAKFEWSFKE